MSTSLRSQLVTGLANMMAGMNHAEAEQFAHELTEEVSAVVAGLRNTNWNLPCFPRETWNPLTIGVPWESLAVATGLVKPDRLAQETVALCSNPAYMDSGSTQMTDLWGGVCWLPLADC